MCRVYRTEVKALQAGVVRRAWPPRMRTASNFAARDRAHYFVQLGAQAGNKAHVGGSLKDAEALAPAR